MVRATAATVLVALAFPAVFAASSPTLEDCAARVASAPDAEDGYRCFREAANRNGTHSDAAMRLEGVLAVDPRNDLARATLAALDAARGGTRAQALYEQAIAGFASERNPRREARARLEWAALLQRAGRLDDAETQLEAARALVRGRDDDELAYELAIRDAWQAFKRGNSTAAEAHLEGVRARVEERGPPGTRAAWLSAKGALAWARERWPDARAAYREEADLRREAGNRYEEAAALANLALVVSQRVGRGDPTDDDRRVIGAILDEAEAAARAGGNLRIRGSIALYRAQLSPDPAVKRAHLEEAIPLLDRGGDFSNRLVATRYLAETLALTEPRDPARAHALLSEAAEAAYRHGDLDAVARSRIVDASLAWRSGDTEGWSEGRRREAMEIGDRAIEAIEAIRDLQADEGVRADVYTKWLFFYDRLVGHLLGASGSAPSRDDFRKAFEVVERMRARVLLERLDALGVPLTDPEHAEALAERRRIVTEAARIRVALGSPFLDVAARTAPLARLRALAERESELRAELAAADPRFERLRAPTIPTLEEAEAAIAPDEAVLAFATGFDTGRGGYLGGGSWLMVHTREGTRAHRLPGEESLAPEAALYAGLFESRDGTEDAGAARLYDLVLRAALDDLDPAIHRLVIVPDGPLHQVPFASLRPDRDAPALAVRFELTFAPSVATWRRFRLESAGSIPASALVIADPGPAPPPPAELREGEGALPHARREARAATRRLPGRSRILEGGRATEASVKREDLRGYGILHVATHARVEDARKGEACILLRPGGEGEDGRLTVAEASSLDLRDRVVVLAACSTARGPFLEGEGVQSLSRGFLAGGARAVIGSLWPLRDDETAEFFDAFYGRLAAGETLASAFAGAQRDRIAAAAPPSAWAGLVLIGDGAARLEEAGSVPLGATFGVFALLVAAGVWVLLRRRAPG